MRRGIFLAIALLAAAGCAAVCRDVPPPEGGAAAAIEALAAAERSGNVPALIGAFADDAVLVPAAGETLEGLRAIADHYRLLFAEQEVETALRIERVDEGRDLAWARGTTTGYLRSRSTAGEASVDDEWVIVLRRAGAEWRVVSLMVRPRG